MPAGERMATDDSRRKRQEIIMIRCPKCDNDTRTSSLVTAQGEVMLAGTIGTDPRPILAQVCTACGYIELYAPLQLDQPEISRATEEQPIAIPEAISATT
jgi:predicted nucleic-acid-binding Zn-ribbon protein